MKTFADSKERGKGEIALASLYRTDVCPMQ